MLAPIIEKKLLQARNHLRLLYTLLGASRVILAALAAFAVSFFLDWLFEFPQGVRAALLLISTAATGYCFIRFFYQPLYRTLRPEMVALEIEKSHPELHDCLLTAMDFAKDPKGEQSYTSSTLIGETLRYAEEQAERIQPSRVANPNPTAVIFAGTLALAAMFGMFFASQPQLWQLFVSRMLFLSNEGWPKHTQIAIEPADAEIVVPRGGTLTVQAVVADRRSGVLHDFAEIESQGLETGKGRVDPMHLEPRAKDARQTHFNWTFSNIIEDFEFSASAGDNRSQIQRVVVKTRPRVEEIKSWLFFPPHLATPDTPKDRPIELQTIRTVMGTRLESALRTNMPVVKAEGFLKATLGVSKGAQARAFFGRERIAKDAPMRQAVLKLRTDGSRELEVLGVVVRPAAEGESLERLRTPADSGAAAILESEGRFAMAAKDFASLSEVCGLDAKARLTWPDMDSHGIRLGFDVRASSVFYFHLVSEDGFDNENPVEFTVQAQPDREPQVRIVKPGKKTLATVVGQQPLEIAAQDDFGLKTLALRLELTRQGMITPLDSLQFPILERVNSLNQAATLLLEKYQLQVGDRISYWAEATDYYDGIDHVGRSHQYQIHIMDEDGILQNIQGRLNRILEDLKAIVEQERRIQSELGAVRLEQALGEAQKRRLLLSQTDQRRVGDQLSKISEEFAEIQGELEFNKVGTAEDLALYKDARDITQEVSQVTMAAILEDLQAARKLNAWGDEANQIFARTIPRTADAILELEELIKRLKRWDQVTEIARVLSKIRDSEKKIKDDINKNRNP